MKSSYRSDFYRSNRDYGNLLGEEEGAHVEEEEEDEEDLDPRYGGNKSKKDEVSIERQEYLRRRQKLKELERQKLKGKLAFADSSINASTKSVLSSGGNHSTADQEKKRHLPYDNYGSFFGPSEPVVARRIIEETRAKEVESLAKNKVEKKVIGMKTAHSLEPERPPSNFVSNERPASKVVKEEAMRKQILRENRDYTFLFSDEDPSASIPERKPASANREKERPKQNNSQVQKDPANSRKGPLPSKSGSVADMRQKVSKMQVTKAPANSSNKQGQSVNQSLKSANGNPNIVKKAIPQSSVSSKTVTTNSTSNATKLRNDLNAITPSTGKMAKGSAPYKSTSISHAGHDRPPVSTIEQRRQESVNRVQPRKTTLAAGSSKLPSGSKPIKGAKDSSGFKRDGRRDREYDSEDSFLDDEEEEPGNISSMIRKMFGYNPNKFRDEDEDDRNMEVSFSRIQAEERRSARIAKEEDERELALIEAEERAERARKEKKRKVK